MKTFIANFGRENYEWPTCLARSTVATMNDIKVQGFWSTGNREAFILDRMKGKTTAGITPTRPVASRWFNLMTIVSETSGDLWIHRAENLLWWTTSRAEPATFEPKDEPVGDKRRVIICHKPCDPWSNKNRKGNRLEWNGLHPKAREFLATESTLGQLGEDNAAYAKALIDGDDFEGWHTRSYWKAKQSTAVGKGGVGTISNAQQIAAVRMADMAFATAAGANGQQVLKTLKNKEVRFPTKLALEKYVLKLIDLQEGRCALTDLVMHFDAKEDVEMRCSLDRIDSDGHYEEGNLQIICNFANRWKSDGDDATFKRLLEIVRSVAAV